MRDFEPTCDRSGSIVPVGRPRTQRLATAMPRNLTQMGCAPTGTMCQFRTHAPQQLFNRLVGGREQRRRYWCQRYEIPSELLQMAGPIGNDFCQLVDPAVDDGNISSLKRAY
jgi:hypothetical protein